MKCKHPFFSLVPISMKENHCQRCDAIVPWRPTNGRPQVALRGILAALVMAAGVFWAFAAGMVK